MAEGNIQQQTNNSGDGYCKMPDGTLIIYGSTPITANANSRNSVSVAYPISFPINVISPSGVTTMNGVVTPPGSLRTIDTSMDVGRNQVTIYLSNTNSTSVTLNISWMVIGRWK